jgi:hypothetical protein
MSKAADIFSFGVILHEVKLPLRTAHQPFLCRAGCLAALCVLVVVGGGRKGGPSTDVS